MFGITAIEPTVHTQNPEGDGGTRALCGASLDTIFVCLIANDPDPQMPNSAIRPRMFGHPCAICARIGELKRLRTYRDREPTITAAPEVRELGTILAALRYWQSALTAGRDLSAELEIAEDGGHAALSTAEIDALCERLNTGGN